VAILIFNGQNHINRVVCTSMKKSPPNIAPDWIVLYPHTQHDSGYYRYRSL